MIKKVFGLLMLVLLGLWASRAISGEEGIMRGMTAAHNSYRAAVGAPALSWSDDLAAQAREWANHLAMKNGCTMLHRTDDRPDGISYGENLFWASGVIWSTGKKDVQTITPEQVVQSWAGEASDYQYSTNTCRTGKICGHYTQVIWKSTVQVGCGRALCEDKSQIWACNYYPPGNTGGGKPY